MEEKTDFYRNLHEQGWAPVSTEVTRSDLEEVMEHYTEFLYLDEQYHDMTRFLSTERGDGDFGQFTRKAGSLAMRGVSTDNKDIFHFGTQTRQVIESRSTILLPKAMRKFLDITEALFWQSQNTKNRAIRKFDYRRTGLLKILSPGLNQTNNDVLRLINYYPNEGDLAKAHFDLSCATLAIGESHEGLCIGPGQNGYNTRPDDGDAYQIDQTLKPVTYQEGSARFFLGAGWNRLPAQYTSQYQNAPLGNHNVIATDKAVNERVMRWAVILFCNPMLELAGYTAPRRSETRPHLT